MSGSSSIGKSLHDALASVEGTVISRVAPAKVNLRLKVLGRRPDGYHLLSMLNCSTSLSDTVRITFHAGDSTSVAVEPQSALPAGAGENLVSKAWRAFWEAFGIERPGVGFTCVIEKRIPIGGGLGGGSSDAAVMLRELAVRFGAALRHGFGLSDAEFSSAVQAAALRCGADVPYALCGGFAAVTGIGECVRPLPPTVTWPGSIVVMVPPVAVPTVPFYEFYRRTRPTIPDGRDDALESVVRSGRGDIVSLVENDFEGAVCELEPLIGEGLRLARSVVPRGTALTGSGSVFFSVLGPGAEGAYPRLVDLMRELKVACHLCTASA